MNPWSNTDMEEPRRLMRAPEVAARLGVPVGRVYELARRRLIPVVHIGRQRAFDPDRIDEWIDNGGCGLREVGSTETDTLQRPE